MHLLWFWSVWVRTQDRLCLWPEPQFLRLVVDFAEWVKCLLYLPLLGVASDPLLLPVLSVIPVIRLSLLADWPFLPSAVCSIHLSFPAQYLIVGFVRWSRCRGSTPLYLVCSYPAGCFHCYPMLVLVSLPIALPIYLEKVRRDWQSIDPWLRAWSWGIKLWNLAARCLIGPSLPTITEPLFRKTIFLFQH